MGQGATPHQGAGGLFDCGKEGLQQLRGGFTPSKRQRKELDLESSTAAAAKLDDVPQMDSLARKRAEAERVRAEAVAGLRSCAEERAMWSRSGVFQIHWSSDKPSDWADLEDDSADKDVSSSPHCSLSLLARRGLEGLQGVVVKKPLTLLESGLEPDPMSPGPRAWDEADPMSSGPRAWDAVESPEKVGPPRPRMPSDELPSPTLLQPDAQGGKARRRSRFHSL
eukprot:TRINITY_DN45714_c0_g1_i1.p1 TRINITY_DN45714_c0_g1~~TRINITY_DN45714_c0_g1_i1.p1  ORF type:complete len:237 (-),score=33.90 TRINITY_DN45714_c0_g1_i1:367-1038(-)